MKTVIKKLLGQKGFSLPEVMLAVGLMGGMSLLVTQVVKQTDQVKKSSQTNANTYDAVYEIQSLLRDPEACLRTLENMTVPGPVTVIRDRNGTVKYEVGREYSNRSIRLSSVTLSRNGEETLINIEIIKVGNKKEQGLHAGTIKKSIPINAEYSPDDRIRSCQSDVSNHVEEAVTEAMERICSGMNMTYDSASRRCFTTPQIGTDPLACPEGESLVAFQLESGRYVTRCEDKLGLQSSCNENELLRRNSDPGKTFSCVDISCSGAGMFLGLDSNGTAQCLTCGAGELPIFINGSLQCKKAPACTNSSGGSGQLYMLGIDSSGDAVCNKLVDDTEAGCASGMLTVRNGSLVYQCCTPDCSAAGNMCAGSNFESANGCGQCTGTKPANCSDSANYCAGTSYPASDDCGICNGTRLPKNAEWSEWGPCVNGKQTRTCSNDQACGGAGCIGEAIQNCSTEPAGKCKGSGSDSTLFTLAYQDEVRNGCRTQYRDQYLDINVSKFKRGNIYSITQGHTFSAEVLPGDTPAMVLQRIADKINAQNMTYPTLCNGAGSTVVTRATVVSSNRMKYHINWQHSTLPSGSHSCNIADKAACTSTPGCSWDTTSTNVCTGWNYTVSQGTCSGTYYEYRCMKSEGGYDGGSGGGGGGYDECSYKYTDQTSCMNQGWQDGCSWGSVQQTCYAGSATECYAKSGCSWKSYPDAHRSCTGAYGESQCTGAGAGVCTWGPRE